MAENRIKELRNEAKPKITLKKLSEMLNEKGLTFTDSQLSKFEKGKSFPRNSEIWEALSEIFCVSVPYLKGDSDYKLEKEASDAYIKKINNDYHIGDDTENFGTEHYIIKKFGEKTLNKIKENMPLHTEKLDDGGSYTFNTYGNFLHSLNYLNEDFSNLLIELASLDEKRRKLLISFIKDIL